MVSAKPTLMRSLRTKVGEVESVMFSPIVPRRYCVCTSPLLVARDFESDSGSVEKTGQEVNMGKVVVFVKSGNGDIVPRLTRTRSVTMAKYQKKKKVCY